MSTEIVSKTDVVKAALGISEEVLIVFTKSDGTQRKMRCTTKEDIIPADKAPKGTEKKLSETTQRVFDLDLGEWRSFRYDNVISVNGAELV